MRFTRLFKARLFFGSGEQASAVLRAVKPDIRNTFSRSHSALTSKENALELEIKAADLTALRASFNSIMRSILASGNILNAFGKKNP